MSIKPSLLSDSAKSDSGLPATTSAKLGRFGMYCGTLAPNESAVGRHHAVVDEPPRAAAPRQ